MAALVIKTRNNHTFPKIIIGSVIKINYNGNLTDPNVQEVSRNHRYQIFNAEENDETGINLLIQLFGIDQESFPNFKILDWK